MKRLIITLLLTLVTVSLATAAGSPSIKSTVSNDVKSYNEGVTLMMDKKFTNAEKQFRKSIALNERFAEAHNNLAYTLRKQGPEHYDEALKHYNRAIALKPGLDEPYMYRGVLYVQMGKKPPGSQRPQHFGCQELPAGGRIAVCDRKWPGKRTGTVFWGIR